MASVPSSPAEIAGFTTLPLALPVLPSFPVQATHYLYLSHHKPKVATSTSSRSLFLVNVPFDTTELHIKHLFSIQLDLPAGRVEDVRFEGDDRDARMTTPEKSTSRLKRKKSASAIDSLSATLEQVTFPSTWDRELRVDGRTAVVTFVDSKSMDAVAKAAKAVYRSKNYPEWGAGIEDKLPALGLSSQHTPCNEHHPYILANRATGYLKHHELKYPDPDQLLETVNKYMTAHAAKEAEEEKQRQRARQEVDEEGFVTVTRGGRSKIATQRTAERVGVKQNEKRRGFDDFYRFQAREKKKARANELIRKFEQDKARIRHLKERRRKMTVMSP